MALNGLSQVNIELSSRCDKSCSFCGHQDPKINKKLEYGDIDRVLLLSIRDQVPDGIVIQMHRDGEPLVYPYLDDALFLFRNHITSIVTNGKKLVEKAEQIIDHCDTVTVSVSGRRIPVGHSIRVLEAQGRLQTASHGEDRRRFRGRPPETIPCPECPNHYEAAPCA
jgi:MoaA/NifB/PqqE/SkfB family radical SAM enzyme